MNSRERILKTLDREEPDKVPYWEHLIQQPKLVKLLKLKPTKDKESGFETEQTSLPNFKR